MSLIKIKINGEETVVETSNLHQLLLQYQKHGAGFAVAVNELFVPKDCYMSTELKEGDQLELVTPMQGG